MIVVILFILFVGIISFLRNLNRRSIKMTGQNVLVIGGTSGLGLSVAIRMLKMGNNVCVAARNVKKASPFFRKLKLDITNLSTFKKEETTYDYIFCCAGRAMPGLFKDLNPDDYLEQMKVNYMGTINALYHFRKYNKKEFNFVMVASTVSYFTFPGYSAYSPSKSALKSFFDSAYLEMKEEGINLYIYYAGSMLTPGFEAENLLKPTITCEIEGKNAMDPDSAASILLSNMHITNEITGDPLTRVFKVKTEARDIVDIFYFLISIILYPISIYYVKYKYQLQKKKNITRL